MTTPQQVPGDQEATIDDIRESGNEPPLYFKILYYGLIAWAVVFMAYYLLSGWSSHEEFRQKMEAHQQHYSGTAPAGQTGS